MIDATSSGSTRTAAPPATSSVAPPREVTTGAPHAAVQPRQLVVAGEPLPGDAGTGCLDAAPAGLSGDAQLQTELLRGLDRAREVLSGLERADGKQVVAALPRASFGEGRSSRV